MNEAFPAAVPEMPVNNVDEAAAYYENLLRLRQGLGSEKLESRTNENRDRYRWPIFQTEPSTKHPEFIKPLAEQTALGRIGNPEDIAKVIVNLLSDDFAWVTAQDIDVSGGFLL